MHAVEKIMPIKHAHSNTWTRSKSLMSLILYDANIKGELEKTEKFGAEILKLSVDMGGSITGEHGVGVENWDDDE